MTNSGRAEAPLILHLFGPFEVCVNGAPLPRLRSLKGRWLLALLALHAGHEYARSGWIERAWLAALLWPDSPETAALANLRCSLKDLRRALGSEGDRLRSPTVRTLSLDLTNAAADLLAFDAAIARGDEASLQEAAAHYRGPLLERCSEEWVVRERQSREQAFLSALETLAAKARASGNLAAAEEYLRRAIAVDPLRESAQRELIQALAAGGNYSAATQVYRELRLRLHQEVSTEPDPETQMLFEQVRAEARAKAGARPAISRGQRPEGMSGRARGEQGLTNLTRPEPRFRIITPDLPAGFSRLASRKSVPHNLPQPVTSFIGREKEVVEVRHLLGVADGGYPPKVGGQTVGGSKAGAPLPDYRLPSTACRLLTLTGSGGTGKTRLALQVAADLLAGEVDGVWLVELAPLADPALVPRAVATALGIREQPDRPLSQTLTDLLKPKRLSLLLDNCEHLLSACAELADLILRNCPGVQILATSREGLNIPGETTYPLLPLSVPGVQVFRYSGDQEGAATMRRRWDSSVLGWMGSRSRLNWPPRGSRRCQWSRSTRESATCSGC